MTVKTKESKNGTAKETFAPPSMKIELLTFRIIGISPLLQNNPASFIGAPETEEIAGKKVYKDDQEAEMRTYKDDDGNYVHPAIGFIRGMVKSLSRKKFGKVSAPQAIKSSVFRAEPFCQILDAHGEPATKYTIDRQTVVIGKARIMRCRPSWFPWMMDVVFEVDTAMISEKLVRDSLNLAGRLMGTGDNRVEKGGDNGRYRCE